MNAFDGVLTALGVLVGGYLGGVDSPRAIFTVVLTTAVGMGVSGFYGSYLVERAERGRAMRELEESTLSSLEDTTIASASRYATIVIAVVDGASPFLAALIVMIPFLFTGVLSMHTAFFAAVGVGLVELLLPRACSSARSRVSASSLSGLRLVVAGVIALGHQPAARRRRRVTREPATSQAGRPRRAGPPAARRPQRPSSARPSRTSTARC